jgi:hypothetical protein
VASIGPSDPAKEAMHMRSIRRTAAVLLAVALAAAVAAPTAAKTERIPYSCDAYWTAQPEAGEQWIDPDGVYHLRGAVLVYTLVGDELCAGTLTGTANFNWDPVDRSGLVWGKSVIELAAYAGGWTANLNAHFINPKPLPLDAVDIWVGSSVRHGFGELDGWQARSTMFEKYHWLFFDDGYAFAAGG